MEYMIGSIPSYTSLGMALLPHKEMAYDNKYKITVDKFLAMIYPKGIKFCPI